MTPVIISGVQPPIANTVRPITDSGMPNVCAKREIAINKYESMFSIYTYLYIF